MYFISISGLPNVWAISKLSEATRIAALVHPESAVYPEGGDKSLTAVMSATHYEFYPIMYEQAAIRFPMKCYLTRGHIGRTSFSSIVQFKHGDAIVMHSQRQIIVIDKKTRRPVGIPEAYRQQFGQPNGEALILNAVPVPKEAFKAVFCVSHSDTDVRNHASHSVYLRFCVDAAAEVTSKLKFQNFAGDMLSYKMQTLDILFQGETFAGDMIECYVWEDPERLDTLLCQIMKKDHKIVFCKMKFYQCVSHSKL